MDDRYNSFEDAINRYGPIITKICFYFASSNEEFKDLRQDALINIWRGWDKFNNHSELSTWIYRVTFNTCVSDFRKNKRKGTPISLETIADISDNESKDLSQYQEMYSLIRSINKEDRAIILMWLDEKSYEEISDITGIKRNTIAVRLKRIKEKLVSMSNR